MLNRYAAAMVRKVRKHQKELGCIREEELLAGDLDYQDFKRLPREDEVAGEVVRQSGRDARRTRSPEHFRDYATGR